MAKRISYPISAVVAFRNSQGLEARGALLRLTRQQVVFEVYNPYSIVQLSEVLTDLRITQGDRETYRGRAVVTNLLNTGLMVIVTASLVDPWSELKGLAPGEILRSYVKEFVADWEAGNTSLDRDVQVATANLRNYLQELSRWLEHSEAEAGVTERSTSPDMVRDFVVDVDSQVAPKLGELYGRFEESIAQVDRKVIPVHRSYVQHELHPLMMCSPFMHRAYTKPLGYAGDYQMVRMMLNEPWEGANSFAKLMNASALRHEAPAAHRNRIRLLAEAIEAEARRVVSQGRIFRVLNIGCGPAVEVRDFLKANPGLAARSEFRLVDFNAETLEHVQKDFAPLAQQAGRSVVVTEQRSIHDIIRASVEGEKEPAGTYDLVYCAGLFDYFRDATCSYLLQLFCSWASEGGLVLVTNVTPRHSSVGIMGVVLEWNLELRGESQMLELAPQIGRQTTHLDPTGVNVFLAIRK